MSWKLDPAGSTVRYEVMKLCTGSVYDSSGWYFTVLSHYDAVNWCYWVSRGRWCHYILKKWRSQMTPMTHRLRLGLYKVKWLTKLTAVGRARRGYVTFRELAWIFTRQGHISHVSKRGETDLVIDGQSTAIWSGLMKTILNVYLHMMALERLLC